MKTRIFLLVLTLSLCMLIGCQKTETGKPSVDGGVVKKEDNKTAPPNGLDKKDSSNSSDKKDVADAEFLPSTHNPIAKSNIKSKNDSIEWGSFDGERMSFKIISAEFSKTFKGKSFGDYERDELQNSDIQTDDKGNITDAHTYIWVKVGVENKAGKCQWTPLQFPILGISEDLTLEEECIYNCYLDGMQDTSNRRDAFFITFEKGEKKEFLLGFYISDSKLDKKVGYYISENSDFGTPDKNSFIVQLN